MYCCAHRAYRLADHLTGFDGIPFGYQRLAGCSDMLLQGDGHARRLRRFHDGQPGGSRLSASSLVRMDSAGKIVYGAHALSSFLNCFTCAITPYISIAHSA